jgi:uncharacterized membrane protein
MGTRSVSKELVYSIVAANAVSVLLFFGRVFVTDTNRYWFLFWNLLLAWIPFFIIILLKSELSKKSWRNTLPVCLSVLYVLFLPNSFYIISDLIHLQTTGDIGVLYDSVLFMSIIMNGLIAGMTSVFFLHTELIKRLGTKPAHSLIALLFTVVGFAVYLGRSLRWNSWDVLARPFGLIYDVSERIINPLAYPQFFVTTLTFALLLGSIYAVMWNFILSIKTSKK